MSDAGDENAIPVGETSAGAAAADEPGQRVRLPVVELLTGRGLITGKSGGGKSILEGTPVYTEEGRKPIEAVEEGDRVLSLNRRTYEQEFRPVQGRLEHESDRLVRITLEDGTELVGTEDHSFLTVEDMEIVPIRGADVEKGTWFPLSRELPSTPARTEIDLAEYAPSVNNVVVEDNRIRSSTGAGPRRLPLDSETGRILGLYLAEGSFDSGKTLQISATDANVRAFLDEQGFNTYERTCNRSFRPLSEFVLAEFGRGAGGKRIPGWAFDTPEEFRAGLLSGYLDGDGTVNERSVTAISKSRELVDGLSELLRGFGVATTCREKVTVYDGEERSYRRLRVNSSSVGRLADVLDLLIEEKASALAQTVGRLEDGDRYDATDVVPNFGGALNLAAREAGWNERDGGDRADAASIHLHSRKQKVGRETFQRLVGELGIEGRAERYANSDIEWKRVVDVEKLDGKRRVYDLDVELNDNFVADGVFVHNSNTASVIAENLLDAGHPLMIVDTDGEYYGLKEEYELLHVGADEECDIQVTPDHAGKLADLALADGVPIILDVSGYLHEDDANELLTAVARQLFAKGKKLKRPFLLLVEEIHEYVPEGGGMDECGRMLVKVGKRGRKHGLGIAGISQRPADVKKDFITQCDWLCWHRLTWRNDTRVVKRVLGSEYAEAVEDLDDGEAFLVTDWAERIRRIQFDRKRTFDAGATPGLEDFERPELKSVDTDLVGELEEISDEKRRREDRIAQLEAELAAKEERIEDLESQLEEARDLSRMAEQFVAALDGPVAAGESGGYPGMEPTAGSAGRGEPAASGGEGGDGGGTGAGNGDASGGTDGAGPAPEAGGDGAQTPPESRRAVERELRCALADLDDLSRGMLAQYRERGPCGPVDAHVAAGGDADRTAAYRRNRRLRETGLVRHAGRGRYAYALAEEVRTAHDGRLAEAEVRAVVDRIERAVLPGDVEPDTPSAED